MNKDIIITLMGLFDPVNETLDLLKKIDKKLDIQASSKLLGQLKTIENLSASDRQDQTAYNICLVNLNESSNYYGALTDQAIDAFSDIYRNHRTKYIIKLVGKKSLLWNIAKPAAKDFAIFISNVLEYASLWYLSQTAAICCMIELNYSSEIIENQERKLAESFIKVWSQFKSRDELDFLEITSELHSARLSPEFDTALLSDRLFVKWANFQYAILFGKDALHSLSAATENFRKITNTLMPDLSKYPDLNVDSIPRRYREHVLAVNWRSSLKHLKGLER